ncbi:MAG TPA: M56 family metallopeptidase [Caulobacteraceae bacterium]|jgi:beta-lactamase regulating signal transducer with metallopeptidase domain
MSDLQPLQAALAAAEAAAASVILPAVAWLLAKAWRRSAAARRLVWVTLFAMLLALPILALLAPSLAVIALPAAPAPMAADLPAAPVAADQAASGGFSAWSLFPIAAAVWLAGLAKLAVEHLVGLVRLELMRRRAVAWSLPVPVPVGRCALLVSEDCPGPMTWGVLRPVIMLPDEALDWTADRLTAVLRHEMAHVRRRDGLAQALALVACALYWPNPLVWRAARALRREAELAADDAVIASGVRPSDYAGQLLELASEWRERRLTPTGLAMAAPPALSQRVQSILSTDAIRTGATPMDTFKLLLLGGVATAALTLARPSVAEIPAPPAPPKAGPATPATPVAPAASPISASAPGHAARGAQGPADPAVAAGASQVAFAEQDVPAVPAPPVVEAQPAPPVPPAPPTPRSLGVRDDHAMTPEQKAELDRQLAQIGPTVDKAIADAHIQETVQRALAAQDAKTREQVARQLADLGPRIQKAIADAHIHELVAQRIAEIQPQIDAAVAQARDAGQRAAEQSARAEQLAQRTQERAARAAERARQAAERARDRDEADKAPPND